MTQRGPTTDHGVHATALRLTESLRSYIEAQYHIRNESLIRERRRLLEEPGAISQRPFVESTPVYELDRHYAELLIPDGVKSILTRLSELEVGIFSRPYVHQATALEAFFSRLRDLIVATGTGSGKTESFLMPIIGQLAIEADARPQSAAMPGVRALLLYPMKRPSKRSTFAYQAIVRQRASVGIDLRQPPISRAICQLHRSNRLSWATHVAARY